MMNKIAQINLAPSGGYKGFGALGLEQNQDGVTIFATFISSTIGLITVIAIVWFIIVFITGALGIITSGGDKNSNESARKKITSGIIGLIVTILGMLIIRFIGKLFGLDLLDFKTMIEALVIK